MRLKGATPLGGGKYALSEGGDSSSSNFYDDPLVNAITKLPSLEEAKKYAGTDPSFYGVQRPGDYTRVVQRQMANDMLGGRLSQAEERYHQGEMDRARATPGYGLIGGDTSVIANPEAARMRSDMEMEMRKKLVAASLAGMM